MMQAMLQNAVDGVWANTIGRLVALLPDWLSGFAALPLASWAVLILALAFMWVWGKFGFVPALLLGVPFVVSYLVGRRAGDAQDLPVNSAAPEPQERPRPLRNFIARLRGGQ